ncbi:hypothetical protein [Sphingomonas sanxanigenens]|uniref:Uncharacterized protein n=1 Tax=Sphingomonas sanxanigenens DSM 19645 = NX02 TaxID=1123269 RepID=W0AH62_9SPHN|nr:hypothetical protein [Sphingomonas sanxanigenens]AHE57244.1 hypothetical protein NX02_28310 [Sphingomonas sanxanigenens DSM 19645 = NX02]
MTQARNTQRPDGEGYDESQRAQILMTTQDAPTDGLLQADLIPDIIDDDEGDDIESFGAEMPEIRQER